MQIVTLSLALIGSLLILKFDPIKGLIIYFIGLCWYPQPLVVSIGTIDFSLSRILIFAIFASIFFRSKLLNEFKWNLMDTFIVLYVLGKLIAIAQTEPVMTFIEREGGGFFDVILPYFAARLIITNRDKLLIFIKSLVIIGIPLAIIGIYQSITGNNPFDFFAPYYGWGLAGRTVSLIRHGFYRSTVTFTVHITFGLFLAGITTLCLGLWYQQVWSRRSIIICFIVLLNFNWVHKDLVNIYIAILVRYGLLGIFPYLCINFLYYKRLFEADSRVRTNADLWIIWCIMSTFVGWNVAMLTVSAMGQVNTLLFMLIGICANLPYFMLSYQDDKQFAVPV